MSYDKICRNGFSIAFGRFYAYPEHVEIVSGQALKNMFLPKLTPSAQKHLRDNSQFVRGQLKHYGVHFEQGDLKGNGTLFLKKALAAGQCDKVPEDLVRLRRDMHLEWISQLDPEKLANSPEWVLERYFLDIAGKPDTLKTRSVVAMPYSWSSTYRVNEMVRAAAKVPGLCHAKASGCKTESVYLGWDQAAVDREAKDHATREASAQSAEETRRGSERQKLHQAYLTRFERNMKNRNNKISPSPTGRYVLTCDYIEEEWPPEPEQYYTMDISESDEPGVFEASYDFGVVEGVMIMSRQKEALETYKDKWDETDHSSDDEPLSSSPSQNSESSEAAPEATDENRPEQVVGSNKRKTPEDETTRGVNKSAKLPDAEGLVFHIQVKGFETGEGVIFYSPYHGKITFSKHDFSTFTVETGLAVAGPDVTLYAWKISDLPRNSARSWTDYSESAYERARCARW